MVSGTLNQHLAGDHDRGQVGGAHPGGEGPQRAVGAGVAVRADDHVAGAHNPLFRQQGMLDAHLAAIVKMGQVLLPGKLPQLLALDGRRDILVGGEVVADQHHPVPVKDPVRPPPCESP